MILLPPPIPCTLTSTIYLLTPSQSIGNVDLINSYFNTNYTQILARGATVEDPIAKLFDAYLSVPNYNFKQYISKKQDDYHDGNLGTSFTHKNLMAQVTAKFTYLKVH